MHTLTIAMRARGKQRPREGRGRWYTPPETQAAEDRIAREYCLAKLPRNLQGPLRLYVKAVYAMPASWSKKKRADMLGKYYESTPDCDNCYKLVADSLNGIAYGDDRHIADAGIQQTWGESDSLTIVIGQLTTPEEALKAVGALA